MNKELKSLFLLIGASLEEKTVTIPEDVDVEKIFQIAKRHNIIQLVFMGMDSEQLNNKGISEKITNVIYQAIYVSQLKETETKKITDKFDEAHIDYMLLKGNSIVKLYPKPYMRLMGDTDILIKLEQYNSVRNILSALNYTEGEESDHDFAWNKATMNLEMHKSLFSKANKDFYSYFSNVWNMAHKENELSTQYLLNINDEYLYVFSHFVKHFRYSGIGYKHFIDLYIMRKCLKLDDEYIEKELEKLNLTDFHNNICSALDCCFNGKEPSNKEDYIIESIAEFGSFGSNENTIIANALRESQKNGLFARITYLFNHAFPPYRVVRQQYPKLCAFPALLPIAWIVRLINLIFKKRTVINHQFSEMQKLSDKNLSEKKALLKYVGLKMGNSD